MPDVSTTPIWAWPTGIAALFIAVKYLWPLMRQSLDTQLTQGRTESGLLTQVLTERDKALARADAAEDRTDKLFAELADVKARLTIMEYQLKAANEQIGKLIKHLGQSGGSNA